MVLTLELGRAQEKIFFIRKEEKMDKVVKDVFVSIFNPVVLIYFGDCIAEVKNGSKGVTLEVYPKELIEETEETDSSEKEE